MRGLGEGVSRARFVMACGEMVNGSGVLAFDEVIPLSIWKEIVRCYSHGHCSTLYVLTALLR